MNDEKQKTKFGDWWRGLKPTSRVAIAGSVVAVSWQLQKMGAEMEKTRARQAALARQRRSRR
jgi:hypothetical protein